MTTTTCRCCKRVVPVMPHKIYTPVAHVTSEGEPCWLSAMFAWLHPFQHDADSMDDRAMWDLDSSPEYVWP